MERAEASRVNIEREKTPSNADYINIKSKTWEII
jgi:hypothetical protein